MQDDGESIDESEDMDEEDIEDIEVISDKEDYFDILEEDNGERETEYLTDEVLRSAHRLWRLEYLVHFHPSQFESSSAMGTSTNCVEVRGKTLVLLDMAMGSQLWHYGRSAIHLRYFYDELSLMPIGRAKPVDTQMNYLPSLIMWLSTLPPLQKTMDYAIKSKHIAGAAIDAIPAHEIDGKTFKSPLQSARMTYACYWQLRYFEARRRIVAEITEDAVRYISEGTPLALSTFQCCCLASQAWKSPYYRHAQKCAWRLKEIDHILSAYNVGKQVLDTKDSLGYLIADVDDRSTLTEIVSQLAMLANTRLLSQHSSLYITNTNVSKPDMGFSDARVTKALQMTKNSATNLLWIGSAICSCRRQRIRFLEVNEASELRSCYTGIGSTDHDKDGEISQIKLPQQSLK
ncbi:hypothetical protein BSLG_005792 [Batrachochytrium salamandrivorans]|nr:hypothetical protein BSLG_005792 [Batrachochytrium salamandrivorans]